MENECIYGIDVHSNFGSVDVRDAMRRCFHDAHKAEIEVGTMNSSQSQDFVDKIIYKAFEESGGHYDNPSVEDLKHVIDFLASYAKNFRNQDVVKKHYSQLMNLINILEQKQQ